MVIAALARPLSQRLQALIDRRFYRRKYNAAKTLAAFNATLRQEVDLATLSEHLVGVVQETITRLLSHCGCVPQPVNKAPGERLLRFPHNVTLQMKDDC